MKKKKNNSRYEQVGDDLPVKPHPEFIIDFFVVIFILVFCLVAEEYRSLYYFVTAIVAVFLFVLNYKQTGKADNSFVFSVAICLVMFLKIKGMGNEWEAHERLKDGAYVGVGIVDYIEKETRGKRMGVGYYRWDGQKKEHEKYIDYFEYLKISVGDTVLLFSTPEYTGKTILFPSHELIAKFKNGMFVSGKHIDSLEIAEDDALVREKFSRIASVKGDDEHLYEYCMEYPKYFYFQTGYSLVYKVKPRISSIDGTVVLGFTNIRGREDGLSLKNADTSSLSEYYCVFRNINPSHDRGCVLAPPEVNTPENWAKISDYGYIFNNVVFSKEEVETKCPEIKEHVDHYRRWGY